MLCCRQEYGGGGRLRTPARAAVPRSVPLGSPLPAAGEKPWKAGTENKQKPFSHLALVRQNGRVGSSSRGARKEQPRAKGGVCYSRWRRGPSTYPPTKQPSLALQITQPSPALQRTPRATILVTGRWGWNKSAAPFSLSTVFGGGGDVPQGLNTQYRDLPISSEIQNRQHEQSPKQSWARPHTAALLCGRTGCSGQRQHLPGKLPFHAIEQGGKLKIDCSAERLTRFAWRCRFSFASTQGAPRGAGTRRQAPGHRATAGPGQGKSRPLPCLPTRPGTARGERPEAGSHRQRAGS